MITLIKDGIIMEVPDELRASLFLRNGYKRLEDAEAEPTPLVEETAEAEPTTVVEEAVKAEEPNPEKPKRRSRKKTTTG